MNCLPVRIFHGFLSGALAAVLLSLGILYFYENVHAKTANFRGNGWGTQPVPSAVTPPPTNPVTSTDSDGDGMPNTWEAANAHRSNSRADASSDFDFDGLTAKQEYDLSVSSGGVYGKPLGTYELATIPDPTGYTSISTMTLVETAKNGMSLVRVVGIRTGFATSTTRIYTYLPATGQWTWVKPPVNVADTTTLTGYDVNARGQVVGYYSSGTTKGFLWTPASSDPSVGESKQFFLDPTASSRTSVFPRRISDTGYLLYSTGSPTNPELKAADPKQLPIIPLVNSWTGPTYMDVNDFGEYVGTINNPITGLKHTFLAIPNGPSYLSAPTTDDLIDGGVDTLGDRQARVDESTIEWKQLDFVYPDDYYDQNDNYVDPYANYPEHEIYDYGTAMHIRTPYRVEIRKYKSGSVIYWKGTLSDGSTWWYEETTSLTANAAALNDWGEFSGNYAETTLAQGTRYNGYGGYETYAEEEQSSSGSFLFNGDYYFNPNGMGVVGMSNDPQVLLGYSGIGSSIWSDSVTAPLSKLLPAGTPTPTKTKICDNGLLILQKTYKILQTLTPADDTDGDGMPDDWEVFYGFNPNFKDASADADGDGKSNLSEFLFRTDPNTAPVYDPTGNLIDTRPGIDTDGDGIPNSWECFNGLDYNDPSDAPLDYDRDGYSNLQEFRLNTDPRGAPSYRIREIGPFPDGSFPSMAPALLGEDPGASSPPALSADTTESFYFRAKTPTTYERAAVWTVRHGEGEGSCTSYGANPFANYYLAHSVSGASLAITDTTRKHIYYWASPSATAVDFTNPPIFSGVSMSPGGKYVVGNANLPATPTVTQRIVWKMPVGSQTYSPLVLSAPDSNTTLNPSTPLYANDYGYIAANATVSGVSRIVLWQVNSTGTAVSSVVLPNLADGQSATITGISNQPDPVIAGTSVTNSSQSRATVWRSTGPATNLGTLAGGNSSSASVISPSGLVGGISTVLVNGLGRMQPFTAAFDSGTSSWKVRAVGNPAANFNLRKINNAGEMYGTEYQITPYYRSVPTLWRSGLAYPLENILPVSSGYALPSVVSMNQNGTLLVAASKNGADTYFLLTLNPDTDADGFPDTYEAQIDFNPFVKNDPALDSDGDGLSDIDEYRNSTRILEADSDGDGMKDGWEISWGFLPLDPTDAALDPDGDGVSNLREFQIGTSPTNIYRVDKRIPSNFQGGLTVSAVGEDGTIIYLGDSFSEQLYENDGSHIETYGNRNWSLPSHSQSPSDVLLELPAYRSSTGYDRIQHPNFYDTGHDQHYGVDPISNLINGSSQKTVASYDGAEWTIADEAFISSDASQYGDDVSMWTQWQDVEFGLHSTRIGDDESTILDTNDSLSPSALAISPSGNLRVHLASPSGERFVINARGDFIEKIPTNFPLEKINNQGDAVSLARTYVAASGEIPAYYSAVVTWCKHGVVSSFPVALPPGTSVNKLLAVSDSACAVLEASEYSSQGAVMKVNYLLDLNSKVLTLISQPGLGTESIVSISAQNERMIGDGPKPFVVTPDGSSVRLESLRVRTDSAAVVPFGTLYSGTIRPYYVNKDGVITIDANNGNLVLQLVPESDTDNDGIPDDWERSVIAQLNDSRPIGSTDPVISSDVSLFDVNADNDGDGRTLKQEWEAGTSDGSSENVRSLLSVPKNPKDRDNDGILNADDADPDDRTVDWMKTGEPVYYMRDLGVMEEGAEMKGLSSNGNILTEHTDTTGDTPTTILRTYNGGTGEITDLDCGLGKRRQTVPTSRYEFEEWRKSGGVKGIFYGSLPILSRKKGIEPLDPKFYADDKDEPGFEIDPGDLLWNQPYEETYDSVVRGNGGALSLVSNILTLYDFEGDTGVGYNQNLPQSHTDHGALFCGIVEGEINVLPASKSSLYWAAHGYVDMDFEGNVIAHTSEHNANGSYYWEKNKNNGSYSSPKFIESGYSKSTATLSQTIPSYANSSGITVPSQKIERHLVPSTDGLLVAPIGGGFARCKSAAGELSGNNRYPDVTADGWISVESAGKPYMWVNGRWNNISDFVIGQPQIKKVFFMQENGMAAVELPSGHLALLIPIDADPQIASGSPDALDPSNPAYAREVKLSGVQKAEEKPQEGAEIDLPGEDTSVDALNRHLRHDTSIAYVDVPSSDLDLAVKLSVDNSPVGIPSLTNLAAIGQGSISEKAMQATMTRAVAKSAQENIGSFGLGWKSNIDATVVCKPKFTKKTKSKANKLTPISPMDARSNQQFSGYDVEVSDENGQTFRFFSADLTMFTSSGVGLRDASGFLVSLTRTGEVLSLNRKYGTSTKFKWTTTPPSSSSGLTSPNGLWDLPTTYTAKLTGFADRFGNNVALTGNAASATGKGSIKLAAMKASTSPPQELPDLRLVMESELLSSPDKLNKFSLVTSVTNPRGYKVKLKYNWVECWGAWLPVLSNVVQPDGTGTRYNYATRMENAAEGAAVGKNIWTVGNQNLSGQSQGTTAIERALNKEDTDDEYGSDEGMTTFFHLNLASVTDPAGKMTSIRWQQDIRYDTTLIWQKCQATIDPNYTSAMRSTLNTAVVNQAVSFRKNREWKKIDKSMAKRGAAKIGEGIYVTRSRGVPDVVTGVSIHSTTAGTPPLGFTIEQVRETPPTGTAPGATPSETLVSPFKKSAIETSAGMERGVRDFSRTAEIKTKVTDLEGNETTYRFSDFQTLMTPAPVKPPVIPGTPVPPPLEAGEEIYNNMSRRKGLGYARLDCQTNKVGGGSAFVSYEFDPVASYALKKSTDINGNEIEYEHNDVLGTQKFTSKIVIFGNGIDDEHDVEVLTKFDDPNSEAKKLTSDPASGDLAKREFKYGPTNRLLTSEVDANGNETVYEHDDLGRVVYERSYAGRKSAGILVSQKSMEYTDTRFKNFVTKETVTSLPSPDKPAWETDLVTTYQADANGFVWKTIVDPTGLAITTEKTYDKGGNVLTSKDAKNNVTTFAYDNVGRLVSTTYPDLTQRTYGYDSVGRKIRETDENGHSTLWKYDGFGRVVKTGADMNGNGQIDAGDLITATTYNNLGQPLTVTDARGNVTSYGYDTWHRLVSTTDPLGSVLSFDYSGPNSGTGLANDPKWMPTRAKDARGFITETQYDQQYRTISVKKEYQLPTNTANWTTRALGPCISGETEYDDNGNVTESRTLCPGRPTRITRSAYDTLDRPYLVTSGFGTSLASSTRTLYTSTGLAWKTVSFEGNSLLERQSVTQFDAAGRAVKSFAPDPLTGGITANSAVSETHYDKNSNADYSIDPLGNRTDFEYDTRNRKAKTIAPAAIDSSVAGNPSVRAQSVTTYDNVGNVRTVADHYGTVTETTYDSANRAIQVIAAKDRVEQSVTGTEYDANGNVTLVTDANGNRTRNFYDAANRLIGTAVNPVSGNPSASLTSPGADDIVVANVYDAGGNLVQVADGAAAKTFSGTAWSFTYTTGHVTGFTYDGIGRKLATTWDVGSGAVAKTETSIYDALHQTERVDAIGQHTQYTYDDLGRLDQVVYVNRTADNRRHLYEGSSGTASGPGELKSVTHPNAGSALRDVSYTHDRLDRLTAESSAGVTHQYAYDKSGNRVLVTYGNTSRKVVSKFDTGNRLSSAIETTGAVSDPLAYTAQSGDRITSYRYDALGRTVRLDMSNGTATVKTFDRLGRILLMNTLNTVGAVVSGYNYTNGYDKVGNVLAFFETSATLPARSTVNLYDKTYRLTKESDELSAPVFYYYDKACNRIGKTVGGVTDTYEFGTPASNYNTNQLRGIVRSTNPSQYAVYYTYDANGNRATRAENGQTDNLGYDYDNRLVSLTKNTGTTALGAYAYLYDYRTRRVWRDEPGTSDAALSFSGGLSVQEYPGAPAAGSQPAVETLRGSDLGGGVGGVLYTLRGGTASFDSYNSRGDVVSQTNSSGAVKWQASYEAFGTRKAEANQGTPNLDRQRANSKDEDPTGLLNEGMRYRDLETGVFITRDPAGFVDGPNVYTYVKQNPWTSFDPDGLRAVGGTLKKRKDKPSSTEKVIMGAYKALLSPMIGLSVAAAMPRETASAITSQAKGDYAESGALGVVNRFNPVTQLAGGVMGADLVRGTPLDLEQRAENVTGGIVGTAGIVSSGLSVAGKLNKVADVVGDAVEVGGKTAQTVVKDAAGEAGKTVVKKPNLNSNDATSNFGLYEIETPVGLDKVGKADLNRLTRSSGLPTRLHQQVRMMEKVHGKGNVKGTVVEDLGETTTAAAKVAEKARIRRIVDETGQVPPGNAKSYKP